MNIARRVATIVAVSGLLGFVANGQGQAQGYPSYGLGSQMSPPYTAYSPVFPTYQPAPTIGGLQQTYNPAPVYTPPPTLVYTPPQTYPNYLPPGAGCIGRIGVGC